MIDPRLIAGVVVAAVAGTAGFAAARLVYLGKYEREVAARASERAAAADALAKEVARNHEIELGWQGKVDTARVELEESKNANAQLVKRLHALPVVDADGLRRELARARGASATASLTAAAACDLRAAAYEERLASGAQLLDEGRKLAVEVARDADDRRAEVRALLSAWPK